MPDFIVEKYQYDRLSRMTDLKQNGNAVVELKRAVFGYDANGRMTSIVRYNSNNDTGLLTTTLNTYDLAGRLDLLEHRWQTSTGTLLAGYDYDYDNASRMTAMNFTASGRDNEDAVYTHDSSGQLLTADRTAAGPAVQDETYDYDENGNREFVTRDGGSPVTWSTGTNNQLTNDGTFAYTYDAEGNRLTKIRNSSAQIVDDYRVDYSWDHRNRLTKVEFRRNANSSGQPTTVFANMVVTKTVDHTYDMFNRWTRRVVTKIGQSPVTEHFSFDGEERMMIHGNQTVGNAVFYTHGPLQDQVLFLEDAANALHVLLGDHLNTIRDIISATGANENHIVWDAYGRLISETPGGIQVIFGFTGRPLDRETGQQNNRERWYDAWAGRWMSEDPIGFSGNDASLARYVFNQPLRYIDPSGMILAVIDGTNSKEFRESNKYDTDVRPGTYRSHSRNFYEDADESPKRYWDGPALDGLNSWAIMRNVYRYVAQNYFELRRRGICNPPIDLVGHSRGGYIAVEVARTIHNDGLSIGTDEIHHPDVRFVGLYDPVDMDISIYAPWHHDPRTIPANVLNAAVVLAASDLEGATGVQEMSRADWTRIDGGPESSRTNYNELYIFGTHAAIGGAPWDGDHPRGHSQLNDIRAAIKSDQFIRTHAIEAGVKINYKADVDYGYRPRQSRSKFGY